MSRRERMEARQQRRLEWAGKADGRAIAADERGRAAVAGIPFGQPILVGHHSEKGHRNAIAKSWRGLEKAHEESTLADHHRSKAAGLERQLNSTIYSDDEDAVQQLEAKIAGLEASRDGMKEANAAWRKAGKQGRPGGDAWGDGRPFQSYSLTNIGATIRQAKKRIEQIKRTAEKQAHVARAGGLLVETHPNNAHYVAITFAEFPGRDVIKDLKRAGFHWSAPSWQGYTEKLPEGYEVTAPED